ncbi:MAG: GGDEF domain-containing protein [Phycisphaerae bacterium]|nr:GGDEF domain-containing protein [Phycisphaerae bacterium]
MPKRILITGDVEKAFLEPCSLAGLVHVTADVGEAITAASGGNYDVIGVVISGLNHPESVLGSFRRVSSAKLVLLAQMYEEPLAIKYCEPSLKGRAVADDYLVCPITSAQLSRLGDKEAEKPVATVADAAAERIRKLEKLATEDELTGLKNRRYLWEFGKQIIDHAARLGGQMTLLIFDIDNFKHYNDVYGHAAGDQILREAALLMQRCCRAHDVVARIGGDEFAVIFWDDPKRGDGDKERRTFKEHPTEPIFISNRFRRQFNSSELKFIGPDGKGLLTISGGLAAYPRDGKDVAQLMEKADNALLDAKRSGKNRIYLVGKSNNDIAKNG